MSARMQDTLERLERWLREYQPAFLDAMNPGATDAELDQLERDIGRTLPEDLRDFYRWRNGIEEENYYWRNGIEEEKHYWEEFPFGDRPLPLGDVRNNWFHMTGLAEPGGWDMSDRPCWWHPSWVPIFQTCVHTPSFTCVDTAGVWTGVCGQIVHFNNKDVSRPILAAGLEAWLRGLVRALEHGMPFDGSTEDWHNDTHSAYPLSPIGYSIDHTATEAPLIPPPPAAPLVAPKPDSDAFRIGDRIRILDGSFIDDEGVVKRIEAGSWHVVVTVIFWGRELDLELEHKQIRRIERGAPVAPIEWNEPGTVEEVFAQLGFSPSVRKLRLFMAACYRNRLADWPEARDSLCDVLEEAVEGPGTNLEDALNELWFDVPLDESERRTILDSLHAFCLPPKEHLLPIEADAPYLLRYATPELIREIFLNPSAPPRFDPAWRTSSVTALAHAIYDQHAFDQMPILADALQDAGCDNDDVLTHCRDASAAHVRGCWVLDLCLGRE